MIPFSTSFHPHHVKYIMSFIMLLIFQHCSKISSAFSAFILNWMPQACSTVVLLNVSVFAQVSFNWSFNTTLCSIISTGTLKAKWNSATVNFVPEWLSYSTYYFTDNWWLKMTGDPGSKLNLTLIIWLYLQHVSF